MRLLIWFSRAFIDAFGITHPSPENERKAALFIGGLFGFFGVLFATLVWAIFHYSQR